MTNAAGDSYGVRAGEGATVTVLGNVTGEYYGVDAFNYSGNTTVTVGGDVTGGRYGVHCTYATVIISGKVISGYIGIYGGGPVIVYGDVIGGNTGVFNGRDVTVYGNIIGGQTGIFSLAGSVWVHGNVLVTGDGSSFSVGVINEPNHHYYFDGESTS